MVNNSNVSSQKLIYQDSPIKPQLRFKEFDNKWHIINLENNAEIKGRIGWKNLKSEEYTKEGPFLIAGKHITNGIIDWEKCDHITLERYLESPEIALKKGDVIFSKDGSLGNPALIKNLKSEATINGTMMLVRLNNSIINPEFFYQILNSDYFFKLLHILKSGSSIPHIFQRDMINFKFPICSLEEQNKIANFLSIIDKKIILMQKKHKNKVIFKNEFFNNYVSKLQNNDCKKIKLDKFITILNKRNKNNDNISVLSLNNKLGFISQEEQFEDRNVASSDTKNYKIVEKGDFAYNPARINVGSIARLTNFDKGIISPMYIVFKTDATTINPVFFENYIFTNYFKLEILKRLEGSVRLILSADSLKNIEISVPNINEQKKISEFLELLSKDIYLSEINLKKLKEFKKGLLQKMFV